MHRETDTDLSKSKRKIWKTSLIFFTLLIILCINLAALAIGGIIYEETSILPTYSHPRTNYRLLQPLKYGDNTLDNEDITIESRYGYTLSATFISNPTPTTKTLVFLHGFMGNRSIGLNYLDLYMQSGFNLLLVDSRAHGESGGNSVTWGNYEKYDLDQWIHWVSQRFPRGIIGIHGISMGAATALMHAELNESNKRVAFYIADSSYSDLETLLAIQMEQRLGFSGTRLPKILLQYANVVAYCNSGFTFHQSSPIRSVRNVTTPILYIHGESDELVPSYMSAALYNATKGPRQIYLFPHTGHIAAISSDPQRYSKIVKDFISSAGQHN